MRADHIKIVRIFNYLINQVDVDYYFNFFLTEIKFDCYKTLGFNGFIRRHSAG